MLRLASPTPAVWALSTFNPPRQFVATKPCHATTSIRSGSAPVAVQAGQAFKAFATDILKAGTKAMVDNPIQSARNTACMLRVQDDGKDFKMVFVRKAKGIRTLYPDVTPSTSEPACRGVVAIR
jgi:hypothetical protein